MDTVKDNASIMQDYSVLKIATVIGNIYQNPELLKT